MGKWDKLNKHLDNVLENLTDKDWENISNNKKDKQVDNQEQNTNNTEKETDVQDNMCISESAWKTFEQGKPPVETACWLKLKNNNVVLAAYANNGIGATGWWKVFFDDGWKRSGNQAYLAKNALWQPCNLFN